MIDAADGNKVYFYHFDRTGSTLALTNQSGAVTDAYAYAPYGELLAHQGNNPQPFTFVGRWGVRQEGASGTLYHMRARYYDATTVRFLSREPLWPPDPLSQSSPYVYANANPIVFADVTGTQISEQQVASILSQMAANPPKFFPPSPVPPSQTAIDFSLRKGAEKLIAQGPDWLLRYQRLGIKAGQETVYRISYATSEGGLESQWAVNGRTLGRVGVGGAWAASLLINLAFWDAVGYVLQPNEQGFVRADIGGIGADVLFSINKRVVAEEIQRLAEAAEAKRKQAEQEAEQEKWRRLQYEWLETGASMNQIEDMRNWLRVNFGEGTRRFQEEQFWLNFAKISPPSLHEIPQKLLFKLQISRLGGGF